MMVCHSCAICGMPMYDGNEFEYKKVDDSECYGVAYVHDTCTEKFESYITGMGMKEIDRHYVEYDTKNGVYYTP